jgi:hypothetical protein
MTYGEAGRALGEHPNRLRYAALTGTVVIHWDGARPPTVWTVPPPALDARDARLELARRYLHVFGPATPEAFALWAGIAPREGVLAFHALRKSLTPVRTPLGDAWILTKDEPTFRAPAGASALACAGGASSHRKKGSRLPIVTHPSTLALDSARRAPPGGRSQHLARSHGNQVRRPSVRAMKSVTAISSPPR